MARHNDKAQCKIKEKKLTELRHTRRLASALKESLRTVERRIAIEQP